MNDLQIPLWALYIQTIVFLFVSLVFFVFWHRGEPERIARGKKPRRRDPSVFWLALATAIWGIGACLHILAQHNITIAPKAGLILPFTSTLNSACFLFAAGHFDYGPSTLKFIHGRTVWYGIALFLSLLVAILTLAVKHRLPDFVLAIIAICVVYYSLFESFYERNEKSLLVLVIISFFMTLLVQYLVLKGLGNDKILFGILLVSSKTTLIVLFFALGITAYFRMIENPIESDMFIHFTGKMDFGSRWIILFTVEGEFANKEIRANHTPHRDLLTLACCRKSHPREEGYLATDMANITPVNIFRVRSLFKDTYVSIIDSDHKGGYRLKIPPQNITFNLEQLAKDDAWKNILQKYNILKG